MICPLCYEALQQYFKFALKCLEWEDKLQQYIKEVRLRRKRQFKLETFLENLDSLKIRTTNIQKKQTSIKEYFSIVCSQDEVDIKHEIMFARDNE